MLPKTNRLIKKKDFELVFREGKGYKEDFLILKLRKNNLNLNRFGFIVSQKVSKKAILRNKIKRRLRELVRLKLPRLKKGYDGVFIATPGLENKDFWEIDEAINKIFEKVKLIEG